MVKEETRTARLQSAQLALILISLCLTVDALINLVYQGFISVFQQVQLNSINLENRILFSDRSLHDNESIVCNLTSFGTYEAI